jgi:hypothetical protein
VPDDRFRSVRAECREQHPEMEGAQLMSNACKAAQDVFPQAQDMSTFPDAVHDVLNLSGLLSSKAIDIRDRTRAFMVRKHWPTLS